MKFQVALFAFAFLTVFAMHAEAQGVKICEPKSVFMDDCNRCRCSDDGFDKSCTRIMCVNKPENEGGKTKRDAEDEEICIPGTMFKVSCNDCICPESGLKAFAPCTLRACPEDGFGGELRPKRQSGYCTPGAVFKLDCNDCICPRSGRREGAACTLKACF